MKRILQSPREAVDTGGTTGGTTLPLTDSPEEGIPESHGCAR